MKQLIQWPRNKYLNVWVCEDAAGVAGYTISSMGSRHRRGRYCDPAQLHRLHWHVQRLSVKNADARGGSLAELRHPWGNSNNPGLLETANKTLVDDTPNTRAGPPMTWKAPRRLVGQRSELYGLQLLWTHVYVGPKGSHARRSALLGRPTKSTLVSFKPRSDRRGRG